MRQIAKIERRQTRLRKIHRGRSTATQENVPTAADVHHHIGRSQRQPQNIGQFLRDRDKDPALSVSHRFDLCSMLADDEYRIFFMISNAILSLVYTTI